MDGTFASAARGQRQLIAATLVCALGFCISLAINYPGFLTYDSVEQLLDARTGAYTDWHPPLMAAIWGVLDRIVPGSLGMLVLQSALVWVGTALLVRAWFSGAGTSPAWLVAPAIVVLLPPVFSFSGAIVKDILMWGAFVLALGLAATMRPFAVQPKTLFVLHAAATLAALMLAIMLRYNAVFAALPILALCALRAIGTPTLRRAIIAGVVAVCGCAVLVAAGVRISNAMAVYHRRPAMSVQIFDVSGVIAYLKDRDAQQALYDRIPAIIRAPGGLDKLLTVYPSYYWETPFAEDAREAAFACPLRDETPRLHRLSRFDTCFFVTDAESRAMQRLWIDTIAHHPLLWLFHRIQMFRHVVGANDRHLWEGSFMRQAKGRSLTGVDLSGRIYGDKVPRPTRLQQAISDTFERLSNTWLYRPWIYLLLGAGVVGTAVWRRDWAYLDTIVVGTSGLAHEAGLFFLAPSADFRYSHYMIYASAFSAALLLRTELVRRRTQTGAWTGAVQVAATTS